MNKKNISFKIIKMMQRIFFIGLLIATVVVQKVYAVLPVQLEKSNASVYNTKKVERGAKHYAQYCLLCHAIKYVSGDPIANKAGITIDKMPSKNQKWWFAASPPDLSLIARIRSANWLYTYLHSFYKDPSRPIGVNNLVLDNVNMPNPFVGIQGEQELIVDKHKLFQEVPFYVKRPHYYSVLELKLAGTMTSDEFDRMTNELVSFLLYASEPKQILRKKMGIWVMLFLFVFIVFAWLLKQNYWQSIKNKNDKQS